MTSRSPEFSKLLQAIKDHTPEANAFLETKIKPMILHTIYKYGLAHQEEDLWQDVRLKVWKKIDTCLADSEDSLKGWIRSVAHNHCRNVLRDEKAKTIPIDDCPRAQEAAVATNPRSGLGDDEFRKQLERALKNDLERTAIELRYLDDYTPSEIARKLSKSINTINTALLRAKKKLRDYFKVMNQNRR